MRTSVIACLIVLFAVGLALRTGEVGPACRPAPHQSVARADDFKVVRIERGPTRQVNALWRDEIVSKPAARKEDALEDALKTAGARIQEWLSSREPAIEWQPKPEFIKKYLVKNPNDAPEPTKSDFAGVPDTYTYRLKVEISEADLHRIESDARHGLASERIWLMGRGVAGLALLLGAVAGFIRLDELTKGFLTWPLRIGALLLGCIGAAVVWFGI